MRLPPLLHATVASALLRSSRALATQATNPGAYNMLKMNRWAVVGDVLNTEKIAHAVVTKLRDAGKDVVLVNPREKDDKRCFTSLRDCSEPPVDVVDLIISPKIGTSIIAEMSELGISNVFIQPGAGSPAILAACEMAGITVHEGCVLREL